MRCLLFADNTKIIAGGGVKKLIWTWQLSSKKLAQTIPSALKRDLTKEEWERYIGDEIEY